MILAVSQDAAVSHRDVRFYSRCLAERAAVILGYEYLRVVLGLLPGSVPALGLE